jgi:multicomponent Na+:H+ antiporter subunit E
MNTVLILAFPVASLWMVTTSIVSIESFIVGYGAAVFLLFWVRAQRLATMQWPSIFQQAWALVVYSLTLFRDIWLSTMDVTRRVLSPTMPLRSGIIAVPTQLANPDDTLAAFSAHGITITPGELVVDFDETGQVMYVHCLDVEASGQSADPAQAKRLAMLRRVMGQED